MTDVQINGAEQILTETIVDGNISASAAIATDKLADGSLFVKSDGSVAMAANLNLASFLINNLANGVASTDAVNLGQVSTLIAAAVAGWSWLGAWSISTAYAANSFVVYNNSVYLCISANTGEEPDISPTYWALLIQGPGNVVPQQDSFNNGGAVLTANSWTLSYQPSSYYAVEVFMDGALIPSSAYTITTTSGVTTLTIAGGSWKGADTTTYTVGQFRSLLVNYYH